MQIKSKEKRAFGGLAKRLVSNGFFDEATANALLKKSQQEERTFVAYLVQHNILSAQQIAAVISTDFGIALVDLDAYDKQSIATELLSLKLIQKHHMIPLYQRDKRLYLATSDPTNLTGLDEIKFYTGLNTEAVLVEEDKLSVLIEQILETKQNSVLGDLSAHDVDGLAFDADKPILNDAVSSEDDAPVVRFIHKILLDAIKKNASDLHFEPYESTYRIRFRLDGLLKEIAKPPIQFANRMAARLKVIAQLDISERRLPQDGRFKMALANNRCIDFRISTCPTLFGEKIVMRILDASNAMLAIDNLGFESHQQQQVLSAIQKSQGMVLVTGPTGSGKTVSLYTALNVLNTAEKNISTVEDPVEINLMGINQVPVNLKVGLTFSSALRTFLRQDPDIIMVGEIRDLETAEIAIKAAQTGHLVLSTLHTNSAPETLTRLVNMGIAPFNIATSVSLIIAQRLARRLCDRCKLEYSLPIDVMLEEGLSENDTIYRHNNDGCRHCNKGYKGRIGLYEVLPITENLGRIIMQGGNALDIYEHAHEKEGLQTLRESGLNKVKLGVTSLEEINRVTKI